MAKVVTAETASSNETCFFFQRKYFKISFEKIWRKEKEFLSLLSTNDYLFTFKNSRGL